MSSYKPTPEEQVRIDAHIDKLGEKYYAPGIQESLDALITTGFFRTKPKMKSKGRRKEIVEIDPATGEILAEHHVPDLSRAENRKTFSEYCRSVDWYPASELLSEFGAPEGFTPAPPHPGIKPGGLAQRAMDNALGQAPHVQSYSGFEKENGAIPLGKPLAPMEAVSDGPIGASVIPLSPRRT